VLTVANHHSCLDDPLLMGQLLRDGGFEPDAARQRWSICREDICYKNELTAALFGAGRTLPIRRGAGLEQPALAMIARKLVPGEWVHLFPEGRVWQCSHVGGRSVSYDGSPYAGPQWQIQPRPYLRWGVGKIVADAPAAPTIVPVYHTGLADVQPLNMVTEKLASWVPRAGNRITIAVGAPFTVDDLLARHREQLRELAAAREAAAAGGAGGAEGGSGAAREAAAAAAAAAATTTANERSGSSRAAALAELARRGPDEAHAAAVAALRLELYAAITRRVHFALRDLEDETRADLGLGLGLLRQQPGEGGMSAAERPLVGAALGDVEGTVLGAALESLDTWGGSNSSSNSSSSSSSSGGDGDSDSDSGSGASG